MTGMGERDGGRREKRGREEVEGGGRVGERGREGGREEGREEGREGGRGRVGEEESEQREVARLYLN